MLKSRAGNDQSVQTVTCAICGNALTLVIVNRVFLAVVDGDLKSTSKYGSSNVAAGAVPMSHESSLFVVVGPAAPKTGPPTPNEKVAFGFGVKCRFTANADPAIRTAASIARTVSFLISFSYTSIVLIAE